MRRTTVFADQDDLAVLAAAAARRGVPEAELIREAIHLAAMANRTWDGPFFERTYPPLEPADPRTTAEVLDAVWDEKAQDYDRAKTRP